MAVFEYRGINTKGKSVKGLINATGKIQAHELLKSQGIFVTEIAESKPAVKKKIRLFSSLKKLDRVSAITRQLAYLIEASLPIINALDTVIEQTTDTELRHVLVDIRERIKGGEGVSKAFSATPKYFDSVYTTTLRAGELSGRLDLVFRALSTSLENAKQLRNRLRASLSYPVLILTVSFIVTIFLVTYVVPTYSQIFTEFGQSLPLPTRILLAFSGFFKTWLPGLMGFLALVGYIIWRFYKSTSGKNKLDNLILRIPIVGNLIKERFIIRFCGTLALMVESGVPLLESIKTTIALFKNHNFINTIKDASEKITKGHSLSSALSGNPYLPPSVLGIIRAGETGDRVADSLFKIAETFGNDFEERIRVLTSLIEPIVIILIGIIVGFIVLSIMLPIFQMNQLF